MSKFLCAYTSLNQHFLDIHLKSNTPGSPEISTTISSKFGTTLLEASLCPSSLPFFLLNPSQRPSLSMWRLQDHFGHLSARTPRHSRTLISTHCSATPGWRDAPLRVAAMISAGRSVVAEARVLLRTGGATWMFLFWDSWWPNTKCHHYPHVFPKPNLEMTQVSPWGLLEVPEAQPLSEHQSPGQVPAARVRTRKDGANRTRFSSQMQLS